LQAKTVVKEKDMVKVRINGRLFTLAWVEFERAFNDVTKTVEILEVA